MCVQRFDDSRNSAIHITYRISLRSSSLREPRDPLSKVVYITYKTLGKIKQWLLLSGSKQTQETVRCTKCWCSLSKAQPSKMTGTLTREQSFCNDPTAGSPTVTLLRLLVPLNDQV